MNVHGFFAAISNVNSAVGVHGVAAVSFCPSDSVNVDFENENFQTECSLGDVISILNGGGHVGRASIIQLMNGASSEWRGGIHEKCRAERSLAGFLDVDSTIQSGHAHFQRQWSWCMEGVACRRFTRGPIKLGVQYLRHLESILVEGAISTLLLAWPTSVNQLVMAGQ